MTSNAKYVEQSLRKTLVTPSRFYRVSSATMMKQPMKWLNVSCVSLALFMSISLAGCHVHQHILVIPVEDAKEQTDGLRRVFEVCFPDRGNDQTIEHRIKGQAFNTHRTGCV